MGGPRSVRPHVHRACLLVRRGALRGRPVQCVPVPGVDLDRSWLQDRRHGTHQVLGPGGPGLPLYRGTRDRRIGGRRDPAWRHGLRAPAHQYDQDLDRFLIESNSDNTYMQNDLGLEVTIMGSLGLRLAYQVRHNTDVLPGVEKTDTLTTVGLIYETK